MVKKGRKICSNCGLINDDDAKYCEKCGFNLNGHSPKIKGKSTSSTVKYLAILCVVLVAVFGITVGYLIQSSQGVSNETETQNNSIANQSVQNVSSNNTTKSESSGSKIIDQMKMVGGGDGDIPKSSDTLKAYEYSPDYVEVIINMHNLDTGEKTKQTITFQKLSGNELVETIKVTGDSQATIHHHTTSLNAAEYYWKVWKPNSV